MNYKLNIIEPWESGTEKAQNAQIILVNRNQFLLFINNPVNVNGNPTHYFNCKLENQNQVQEFEMGKVGVYKILMALDSNISHNTILLPDFDTYRGGFLLGEVSILNSQKSYNLL